METTLRNWTDELKIVNDMPQGKYLKLKAGVPYQVSFLDEGSQDYPQTFEDRTLVRVDFSVQANGGDYANERVIWSLTKGGKDSLYGKLCVLFAKNGKSSGYKINIMAEGDGKLRKYQLKEYNDLMFARTA